MSRASEEVPSRVPVMRLGLAAGLTIGLAAGYSGGGGGAGDGGTAENTQKVLVALVAYRGEL